MKPTIEEILAASPVIPVVVLARLEEAVPLARALVAGGIRVIEVTLRTPIALEAIRLMREAVPEALVGAGTVTGPGELAEAERAGAVFAVTPGLTPPLVEASRHAGIPVLPGVMTPSEAIAARDAGFSHLKLFPAGPAGGVAMLKALAGPLPGLRFCPTGGITAESAPDYLRLPNVACVGGSWITPPAALASGDWPLVTRLAAAAARLARG